MGGSDKQPQSPEDDEFDETLEEIQKILENRVSDLTDAYIKSGKDVEWYIHFIRCLESIKRGPPAKDTSMDARDHKDDTSNSRSNKWQRAIETPFDLDFDADEDIFDVVKTLIVKVPAICKVIGPTTIRIKTKGEVIFRTRAAATVGVEEAGGIEVNTENLNGKYL